MQTVDTGQIAELLQVTRRHVTDKLSKSPDFPAPVINRSERLRRWRLIDVMSWKLGLQSAPLLLGFNKFSTTESTVKVLRSKLGGAKRRSRKRGRECLLTLQQLKDLHAAQQGRCAVSGIFMPVDVPAGDPFAPSLDRIDSSGGYELGNVRLVCHAVNLLMNKWGERVFHELMARRGEC
jgi:hypothetical protein